MGRVPGYSPSLLIRAPRKISVVLAAGICAALLSGCVGISGAGTNQPESLGPVQLSVSACASGSPGCSVSSNSGAIYELIESESVDAQALLAIRLPLGSTPPDSLTASLGGGGLLGFSRSASYEGQLQALEPAPEGERWWGWISVKFTYSKASKQSFSVGMTTTLPHPEDDSPLASPMHWRPVVGVRAVTPGLAASRSVKCGTDNEDLYTGYNELGESGRTVVCVDSPSESATRGFLAAPIVDFGILGTSVEASPGGTVTAAFVARRTGEPDPSTTFALNAQSAIPDGSLSIDRTSVSLGGDSSQPVLATIGVPRGTPPGDYPVTLTATAGGKPARAGTVIVRVTDPNRAPSIRSASLSRKRFRARRGGASSKVPVGTKLKLDLSEPAQVTIRVARLSRKGSKTLGANRRQLPRGRTTIVIRDKIGKVKLTPGRYRLRLVARDAEGLASAERVLAFTVVR